MTAKPWADYGSQETAAFGYWPNLKRGLCFFAAEYSTKTPLVADLFKKHLIGDSAEERNDGLIKEFSDESPILKDILTQAVLKAANAKAEAVKNEEEQPMAVEDQMEAAAVPVPKDEPDLDE